MPRKRKRDAGLGCKRPKKKKVNTVSNNNTNVPRRPLPRLSNDTHTHTMNSKTAEAKQVYTVPDTRTKEPNGPNEPELIPNEPKDIISTIIPQILTLLSTFYEKHRNIIDESHGFEHALAVHRHAQNAIAVHTPKLSTIDSLDIQIASLLHDVDDRKYFSKTKTTTKNNTHHPQDHLIHQYPNAHQILCQTTTHLTQNRYPPILQMIHWVSCSQNGNSIPNEIQTSHEYHRLIPRWADRLEAVGERGVVRCYLYNRHKNLPLCDLHRSPRPSSVQEVWNHASPQRFLAYQQHQLTSNDMISHYYDKLLHIARPPPEAVRNRYLIQQAERSAEPLVQVCLRYGITGIVDEEYIRSLMVQQS